MGKRRKPFVGFTAEEILRAEENSYVVILGNDFYYNKGDFVFSRQQAEKHYDILLSNILRTLDQGTERQRLAAMKCLVKLQIQPLRVQ